jgi:hypothetical protein
VTYILKRYTLTGTEEGLFEILPRVMGISNTGTVNTHLLKKVSQNTCHRNAIHVHCNLYTTRDCTENIENTVWFFRAMVLNLGSTEVCGSEHRFQGIRELGCKKNHDFIFTNLQRKFSIPFNNECRQQKNSRPLDSKNVS